MSSEDITNGSRKESIKNTAGNVRRKKTPAGPRCRWVDTIKMDLR
jgi:hypothetical protein